MPALVVAFDQTRERNCRAKGRSPHRAQRHHAHSMYGLVLCFAMCCSSRSVPVPTRPLAGFQIVVAITEAAPQQMYHITQNVPIADRLEQCWVHSCAANCSGKKVCLQGQANTQLVRTPARLLPHVLDPHTSRFVPLPANQCPKRAKHSIRYYECVRQKTYI